MCFRPPTVETSEDNVCSKCGAELFVGVTKCPSCGEKVDAGHTASVPLPKAASPAPKPPKAPGK